MQKAVCIISGGMDSTVLLHYLTRQSDLSKIYAVSFNYGQRHSKELECASEQAGILGIDWTLFDLSHVVGEFKAGSALLKGGVEMPEGHYAADNMKATVVPNRNMLMLSIAAGFGISLCKDGETFDLAYGAHAGDHDIYPDCRKEFTDSMRKTLELCDWKKPMLVTPFVNYSKADLVKIGLDLGVDFSKTWTCYKGELLACGKCGTCVERLEAFAENSVEDPLEYEDREFWKTVTK